MGLYARGSQGTLWSGGTNYKVDPRKVKGLDSVSVCFLDIFFQDRYSAYFQASSWLKTPHVELSHGVDFDFSLEEIWEW